MLQGWFVIAVALAYIGLLFVVASYGDRLRLLGREGRTRLLIYPLSLAIYCTSWTFFGSVGLASRTGYDFLAIYLGPMLMIGVASPLLVRIVRLAKAHNITSIADFIAARYGKHQAVAATVALIAIVGTIPYIALQLKAVSASLGTILSPLTPNTSSVQPVFGDIALLVALSMAAFAVLFGTRHIDATEHQHGLMLAVAAELMVKLIAFVAVGIFVMFFVFDGPALFALAVERPATAALLTNAPHFSTFVTMTLLSFVAILLLPRQFHVAVVENNNEAEIRRATWLFPLYLVLINLFVIPIAIAGLLAFKHETDSDMFVLALPLSAGSDVLALIAFIGGLSAATAMVIVELVALAIMVSNDLVVPFVLKRRATLITGRQDIGKLLLKVRRIAIFAIVFFAYLYYRSAGDAQLASIGLLSFAAVAQLAPAFFGGLVWRRGTARGAIAGMTAGFLVWAYTLLLPSFADAGLVGHAILNDGPAGLSFLRPQALFGLDLPPLVHGVVCSLVINILSFIAFSFGREPSSIERLQADLFVPAALAPMTPSLRLWRTSITVEDVITTVARYLGEERTRSSFDSFSAAERINLAPKAAADFRLLRYAEHLLASAIGAASSRLVLSLLLRQKTVSTKAALKLLDDASAAIHYNREILQTALDHVRQGIAVFDKDLHLICWNRQFGEVLGLPSEIVRIGIGIEEFLRFNAENGAFGPGDVDELLRERLTRYVATSESFLERFPNRGLVVEVRTNRIPGGGIVTTFTDITSSVEAAEALERARDDLELRVRERTRELERLNTELVRAKAAAEDANISKTRFLAAASHDILQPLNGTSISAAELERRCALVRRDMADQDIDALVMQNTNDWLGGYVKWFTDVPANNGYPRTVIFYQSDWMTVIEMGPFGSERDFDGKDPLHRGVGKIRHTPSFLSIDYTEGYDADLTPDEIKRRGCVNVGLVNPGGIAHAFASRLQQGLAGQCRLVDATRFVDRHKAIKSKEEIGLIRRTASLQDQVFARVVEAVRPGLRDIDITSLAQCEGQKLGSEQGIFLGASARVGTISPFMPRRSAAAHAQPRRSSVPADRDQRPRRVLHRDRAHHCARACFKPAARRL